MNYKQLYETFITHCKNTTPGERMIGRNKNDFRKDIATLYTEIHHIIPSSLGGSNDVSNLVALLPEEHLFAHKLRYKAFNEKVDFIAVRFIINGLYSNKRYKDIPNIIANKINNAYAWMKQNSADFRHEHGWQTEDGRMRIANARKNTFPVKCNITGEIIGSFDKNHPKIVSGEWVHHSKGMHSFYNKITGESLYCGIDDARLSSNEWTGSSRDGSGINNFNYSGISDDEIKEFYSKVCLIIKNKYMISTLPPMQFIQKLWNMKYKNRTFPALGGGLKSGFRFNGDLHKNLFQYFEKEYNMKYDRYTKFTMKLDIQEVINDIN